MVTLWQRNILTGAEVVRGVVMELVLAEDGAERVIANCAAVLSPELRNRSLDYVGEVASSDYRGWYFAPTALETSRFRRSRIHKGRRAYPKRCVVVVSPLPSARFLTI
jgi:hypothetical protein